MVWGRNGGVMVWGRNGLGKGTALEVAGKLLNAGGTVEERRFSAASERRINNGLQPQWSSVAANLFSRAAGAHKDAGFSP